MRLLQIFNQYQFHGGEEAWVDKIPSLLGTSFTTRDLRFYSNDWIVKTKPSRWKQLFWIGDNPSSRSSLRDAANEFRPDILLFPNVIPVGSLGLYYEARDLGIPVLQYTHNFRPFSPSGTLWNGRRVINDSLHGNPLPEIISGAWQQSSFKSG